MSCSIISGAGVTGNRAKVTTEGQLKTHSVVLTEESRAAERGELFNFGSSILTITDEIDTPLFYLKNVNEERDLKITSITLTLGPSANASGQPVTLYLHKNIISGTILNNSNIEPINLNMGSGTLLDVDSKIGGAGTTMVSGFALPLLLPHDSERYIIDVDSIVIPRGRSVGISFKAGAGNTNVLVSANIFFYLRSEESAA